MKTLLRILLAVALALPVAAQSPRALGPVTVTTLNGNSITAGSGTLNLGSYTITASGSGTLGTAAFTASTDYLASALTGKAVWVDGVNGNDTTGTRGRLDKPYLTVTEAKADATSGDTIIVLPGSYTVTDSILKTGVNWHVLAGATITFTNAASEYGLLDDKGAAITSRITGSGSFVRAETVSNSSGGIHPRLIGIAHASTDLYIEADKLIFTSAGAAGSAYVFWQETGTLHAVAKYSFVDGYSGLFVGWLNGPGFIQVQEVIANSCAVYSSCNATPTGDLYVDAQYITLPAGAGVGAQYGVWNDGTNATAAVWVRCAVMKLDVSGVSRSVLCSSGKANKVYLTAQKLWGNAQLDGDGVTYISADKWTATQNGGVSQAMFAKQGAGTTFLDIDHYDPSTFTGHAIRSSGGTLQILGGSYTAASGGGLLCATGGTILARGMHLDTTANSAVDAVTVSGGTLSLIDTVALAEGTQDDLTQSGGTLYVTGGRGSATAGRYRTSGTITAAGNDQPGDADLDDLADGSLTGSKVGTGISGTNITTGTVASDRLPATVAYTGNSLSQFAPTSSAELRGVLSDENGSGVALFSGNTSQAMTTPVITGAIGLQDDVTQTFNPGATNAGLNIGSVAVAPSAPANGDAWYDSVANEWNIRAGGVTVALNSAFVYLNGNLGTPTGGTLTNATGLPVSTGISGLGTGVATFLGTPSFSNLSSAVTGDTLAGSDSTNTFTNKTLDASGTGNTLKTKGFIYLTHPHLADGTGATIGTTATSITYGHATFSNSADKAANYVEYYLQVPDDIDTSVALRARLKVLLGGADTAAQRYVLSSVSVADSAVPTASTLANEINVDFVGDGSGASGDVETSAWTTLTSWAGALTAGQTWRIRFARDGDTSDASTVNSTELGLVIEYGVTQ